MKTLRTLFVMLSLALIVAGMGCAVFSKYVTPAEINRPAVRYAVEEGAADPNDYDGYPNVIMSERLVRDVDIAYTLKREKLDQAVEREDTIHGIHQGVVVRNHRASIEREEMLFGEGGLLPMIAGLAGCSGLAGFLGLMRKRPGDITPVDMERSLATATGKVTAELDDKERQFMQLVKGVQAFIDPRNGADPVQVAGLKVHLDKAQDKDTQAAVAVVKKIS